ncbi:hypothetical protein M413DRAFT_447124 [Hebeloma cylindrosporum]|uniref:Uncharacterized protein n=1 Tax=Hebeloma cylindrosporum TaxID=76867 RepID=A0A0C3BSM7_HEBCY|nr:hypothetical protein M413DRAFT_447124 [Hebeloma cylindrosporum h7]
MAQAVFDEHPLEGYLRDAGESPLTLPGISLELEREMDPYHDLFDSAWDEEPLPNWCPQILLEFIQLLQSAVSSAHTSSASSPFIERFKYTVISSSLLAPSLPTPHPCRPPRSSSIPGKLPHSRGSSLDFSRSITPPPTSHPEPSYAPISFAAGSAAIFFSMGYPFFFLVSAVATLLLYFNLNSMTEMFKHDMTPSFNALDDLVAVNKAWECVVQEAASHLDNEDRNILSGSSSPSTPSPIRVALYSCLETTHTQCDNIRHLFSALTLPTELLQLSEMYAPPSPIKSGFTPETSTRPFSFPSPRLSSPPQPTTPENKRATWNGSYASLAYAGSPTNAISRRRDKHRTHLSDVFGGATSSAPTTPLPRTPGPSLPDVAEDDNEQQPSTSSTSTFSPLPSSFGSAALDLQRNRKSDGMEAFQIPPSNYFTTDLRTPRSARNSLFFSTISASSKFTSVQPARHPLSYSSLTHSLQGALAAKRYACSHLLALRFGDEEDEGYWEDVRSVMGLLTSALADSCSRLSEALDEVENQKLQDQHPTPETSHSTIPENDIPEVTLKDQDSYKRPSRISFAPMPSHLSRFAAHIAAISSALDDAREHLDQCVSSLKSDPMPSSSSTSSRSLRHSRSLSKLLSPNPREEPEVEAPRALQAYERLRRELGLALRECERGKERLLEIVNPPPIPSDDEDFDDLPGLGHDGSDDSDKPDPNSPSEDEAEAAALAASNTGRFPAALVNAEGGEGEGNILDDATSHLLLTTSTKHLPLPGIEEVFEADTGAKVAFSRERSRLSREERIKLAKARRESGQGLAIGPGSVSGDGDVGMEPGSVGIEKWGPGGEVVQELKDVIWKVGERRRKMADPIHPEVQDDAALAVQAVFSTLDSSTLESS